MTSRDWLDEQMQEADLWREAEEARRDEIEAQLRDDEDTYCVCGKVIYKGHVYDRETS